MKKVLSLFLAISLLCTAFSFTGYATMRKNIVSIMKDDFSIQNTAYKTEGLERVDAVFNPETDNENNIITTVEDGPWYAWMLNFSMEYNGYKELPYNMVCSAPNADGSLIYKGDFGGKIFSAVVIYTEELVDKLAGGDWFDWKVYYHEMPVKMYAGETEDSMEELEINYFKTAAWYPENYLEYIVDEIPENTHFLKVVIPGASEEDYKHMKLACVSVTDDKDLYTDAYVNAELPFTADDACEVRLQKFFVNGVQTTELDNGSIYGKTVIHSCRSASIDATMFVSLYKNNEMVEVKSDHEIIAGYQNVVFSNETDLLTIPEGEDPSEYSVKMWVLTDIGSIDSSVSIGDTAQIIPEDTGDKKLAEGFIHVLTPAYTSEISGDTTIKFYIPELAGQKVSLSCWKQNDTPMGEDFVVDIPVDSEGYGTYLFEADKFPHGPLQIRLYGEEYDEFEEEYIVRATTQLQVYNIGGVSFQEGLGEYADSILPDVAKNLKLKFADDYTDGNLSMARMDSTKTYGTHKYGLGDWSGVFFRDFEDENLNAFSQFDTYLRIRADENKNSSGVYGTIHQDGKGILVMPPAYLELRMVAPYEKGTWPAIWTMTLNRHYNPIDEADLIEAYGFDDYVDWAYKGFVASIHEWNREPTNPSWNDGKRNFTCNMNKVGDGTSWFVKPHTYGYYLGLTDTIYFIDGEEIWRHPTWDTSKTDPTYFMANLAIGGASGWPMDLSRYDGYADMYIDYMRIFEGEK